MKRAKILIIAAILTLACGAYAQHGVPSSNVQADSSTVQTALSAPKSAQNQNKSTSVNRPTKKTNWSKIKTLFE